MHVAANQGVHPYAGLPDEPNISHNLSRPIHITGIVDAGRKALVGADHETPKREGRGQSRILIVCGSKLAGYHAASCPLPTYPRFWEICGKPAEIAVNSSEMCLTCWLKAAITTKSKQEQSGGVVYWRKYVCKRANRWKMPSAASSVRFRPKTSSRKSSGILSI